MLFCIRILKPLQKLTLGLLTLFKHTVILILLYQRNLSLLSKLHLRELYVTICKHFCVLTCALHGLRDDNAPWFMWWFWCYINCFFCVYLTSFLTFSFLTLFFMLSFLLIYFFTGLLPALHIFSLQNRPTVMDACLLLLCYFSFFCTKPRDWLGRTSPEWPILRRVERKTLTQSIVC